MYRCIALAGALACFHASAPAQLARAFPADALRGELVVVAPPEVVLNGAAARLAPGARIHGQNNLLQMSATLIGAKLPVNYTVDSYGLLLRVWILRPEEASVKPWPRTAEQARAWSFDPVAQLWSRP